MIKLKVKYEKGAFNLEKAHSTDAGYDIKTPIPFTLAGHSSYIVDTGIHCLIPGGYVGMIKSKSGLNVKHSITVEGVVDSGYTGTIVAKLYNHSNKPYVFDIGDKITQLVIMPIPECELVEVDNYEETDRGENGFGSTGR